MTQVPEGRPSSHAHSYALHEMCLQTYAPYFRDTTLGGCGKSQEGRKKLTLIMHLTQSKCRVNSHLDRAEKRWRAYSLLPIITCMLLGLGSESSNPWPFTSTPSA